jgi:hypothetical protein
MSATPHSRVISEIVSGDGLSLSHAARTIATGSDTHADPSTIWRWARKGYKLENGEVIFLEVAKLGGKWLTSKAALTRFLESVTAASTQQDQNTSPPVPQRSAKARSAASQRASAKLAKMGA